MVTDYLLATAALLFAARLLLQPSKHISTFIWIVGFLIAGSAAATGGTYHALGAWLTDAAKGRLWNATVALMGASGAFFISAVIASPPDPTRTKARFLHTGLYLTLAGFAIQLGGLSPHRWFDHNDLYHCVQIGASYLFFRAAKLANEDKCRSCAGCEPVKDQS